MFADFVYIQPGVLLFQVKYIILFLQRTLHACRLPVVQGGTFAFLTPTFAILSLPQWKCPTPEGKSISLTVFSDPCIFSHQFQEGDLLFDSFSNFSFIPRKYFYVQLFRHVVRHYHNNHFMTCLASQNHSFLQYSSVYSFLSQKVE